MTHIETMDFSTYIYDVSLDILTWKDIHNIFSNEIRRWENILYTMALYVYMCTYLEGTIINKGNL